MTKHEPPPDALSCWPCALVVLVPLLSVLVGMAISEMMR
jgi:hypothetical protein